MRAEGLWASMGSGSGADVDCVEEGMQEGCSSGG